MAHGDFVWCDLSTYRSDVTKGFYEAVIGWCYVRDWQSNGDPYFIASNRNRQQSGLFDMPAKYREIGLPSFWMSYIEVSDIEDTVARAEKLGGKIELKPTPSFKTSRIALIRDPLGAGFTVIEKPALPVRDNLASAGSMVWNALYVSNAAAVIPFYQALFGWISSVGDQSGCFAMKLAERHVSDVVELPEEIRGASQFWGVFIGVNDLTVARDAVEEMCGKILYETSEDRSVLIQDPDGAALFLRETGSAATVSEGQNVRETAGSKWKTLLALAILWIGVVFEVYLIWGILFLLWVIPALKSGETYLVEPIKKLEHPVLYWALVSTWIVLSAVMIAYGLWPATS